MTSNKVSIIVSNFNGIHLDLIKKCMNSMINPGYIDWELIVVDNASKDNSVEYLKSRFKKYKNCFVIENPINNYSQGMNLGANKAKGKYLAYFNNDVKITKNYLTNMVKELEKDNKVAIAQGKLLSYKNYKKIDSAGETMDIYGNPITLGHGENDHGQYDSTEEILSASGSACIIRKSAFKRIGGYDSSFCIGYEDMDLALRARRLGYKIKRFPEAIVYHKRAATDHADFIKVKVKWHFNKNRIITMIKNYPSFLIVKTLPITLFIYAGIILYESIIKKNLRMAWVRFTALFWIFFNLFPILSSRSKVISMGAKNLNHFDLSLFSTKNLFRIFKDFFSKG